MVDADRQMVNENGGSRVLYQHQNDPRKMDHFR